jgi:hypothetical protein
MSSNFTPTPETLAAAALHDKLMAWLIETCPQEPPHIVLAALTYEIARIVATAARPGADVDEMLDDVKEVMREQLEAYRTGRLGRFT